jgi:hypothetical protein
MLSPMPPDAFSRAVSRLVGCGSLICFLIWLSGMGAPEPFALAGLVLLVLWLVLNPFALLGALFGLFGGGS